MKRFVIFFLFAMLFGCLSGCSGVRNVENKEMTLSFSYGERSGIYTGEIEQGIPEGKGTFESTNAENVKWIYTGDWKQGMMDGVGVFEWEDGTRYEGGYKAGEENGEGKWYYNDELILWGIFEEGRIISLNRDIVHIADNEPLQYVQMGNVGFQIPKSWSYELESDCTVYVSIPNADNVGIVYSVAEDLKLNDSDACEGLKNSYISEYGKMYSEYKIVSENYKSGYVPEYDLHLTFYEDDMVIDVYSNSVSKSAGTYTLTIVQIDGTLDYSEAAMTIQNTMKNWDSIQQDIANLETTEALQNAKQYLEDGVDWEGLEATVPKVTAEEIIKHTSPQEKIVLVEGIIDNISKDKFDLWIPYESTYYRDVEWKYNVDLGDISEGATVQVCIETHKDGSLKQSDGILAIRKLNVGIISDIETVYKKTCPSINYKAIMRNPDKAYGTICKATGLVLQVVEMEKRMQEFLLELDDGSIAYVVYYKDENADNVLEDDYVTVYGMFYMTESYISLFGETKTVPRLSVDYVDLQ